MMNLDAMELKDLVRPEGWDCDCGRHHVCPLEFLSIGRGVLVQVPEMVRTLGAKKPYVLCDENTYAVAGKRVTELLEEAGIPYICRILPGKRLSPAEWEVGNAVMYYDTSCDLILGVGSGVINDICKVLAKISGKKSAVVGTAPSMDGYASNSSAMERDRVKITLYNQAPRGILLDVDLLREAPMRMLWAGLGDMTAKYLALCEWRIAQLVNGEFYCENVAQMMRGALQRVMEASDGLAKRDPDAILAIAEGLVRAGIAMAYAGISRPASGLEHYFSHMWEMMALERGNSYDLHGIQVGVGTLLSLGLFEKIKTIRPDRALAEKHMQTFNPAVWEAQVRRIFGKTAEQILAIEQTAKKNDPEKHAKRLNAILEHWEEILRIIEEELPEEKWLREKMAQTGMPLTPAQIGVPVQDVVDAFVGAREIRDKYLCCSFLWDLGLTEEFSEFLKDMCETRDQAGKSIDSFDGINQQQV